LKKEKRLKSEVMYTSVEAARLLGVTPRTIQIWADSGVLTARKTSGGHRRFQESVLEAFLQKLETDQQPVEEKQNSQSGQEKYRVLIAEDEPDLRSLYEMTMQAWNLPMDLKVVKDGYEALIRLGIDRPDMLITDLNMPNMDGFHMLSTICSTSKAFNTEVVVVTALSKRDIEARGGVPESVTVLYKPIPFEQLKLMISNNIQYKLSDQDG